MTGLNAAQMNCMTLFMASRSIERMSDEKRFRMRPTGVRSYQPVGARMTLWMWMWIMVREETYYQVDGFFDIR